MVSRARKSKAKLPSVSYFGRGRVLSSLVIWTCMFFVIKEFASLMSLLLDSRLRGNDTMLCFCVGVLLYFIFYRISTFFTYFFRIFLNFSRSSLLTPVWVLNFGFSTFLFRKFWRVSVFASLQNFPICSISFSS